MLNKSTITFRELEATRNGLSDLTLFYKNLYIHEFPDPDERESLVNMKRYLILKSRGYYGKNNYHIIVAETGGKMMGGAICDYLSAPNVGIIEFLFVSSENRTKGVGRALLDKTTRLLQQDARRGSGKKLKAITAEINDPFHPQATPDNINPFERAAIWGQWGFYKISFPYQQPALSSVQKAVDGLVLIIKRFTTTRARSISASWVMSVIREYMRWAMRIKQPRINAEYKRMARYLRSHLRIPVLPIQTYIGRNSENPFHTEEIGDKNHSFYRVMALVRKEIRAIGRVASSEDFKSALANSGKEPYRYHLWSLHRPSSTWVEGLASFFTLRSVGFGGYIVLAGALRGKGLLRSLVARIEERMISDKMNATGWYIECGSESLAAFCSVGFAEIPLTYRPPSVGMKGERSKSRIPERLHLLYKKFGESYENLFLNRKTVLRNIEDILRHVYRFDDPKTQECYQLASQTLESDDNGLVRLARPNL